MPSKKRMCDKRIVRGPWFVNCQKQFTYPVCGKYVAQTFDSSSLSNLFLEGSFHSTYCQGLWSKQMNYMLFLPWQNDILQQLASTFGCLKELMMCLHC